MRLGLAVFGILLASALLARDGSAANDPNRWLVGFGKALFWMSETEIRHFYPIADSYNESGVDTDGGLRLVSGVPAVLRDAPFDLSFVMKSGRLFRILLEREASADARTCGGLFRQAQEGVRKLHGPGAEEEDLSDPQRPNGRFLFNGGGRIEVEARWAETRCDLRLTLTRAAPGSL
jgi:hypothetical protein